MIFAPPDSPYIVSRQSTDRKIVSVHDFAMTDVLVILLHLCRTFPVVITYPEEAADDMFGACSPGFLWLPLAQKKKMDREMKKDSKITWEFVCIDLVNGEECVFYRDRKLKAVTLIGIKNMYFTKQNRKPEIC
jgi:hypothetical protein